MTVPHDQEAADITDNASTMWAKAFVAALAAGGLQAVCVSPGSRSTPLALAFYNHPDITLHLLLDERSAGFFALGLALAGGQPVALLCTSGTAGANYFPAIIEAKMSEVPLLVLTTDRPPELRHSGANQTIDQVKMFGDQVLWSVDMALPQHDAPSVAWRNLRRTAVRALATADGLRKGPVHLNFPFRKPLEPADPLNWGTPDASSARPLLSITHGKLSPTAEQVAACAEFFAGRPRGLIIAGPGCPGEDFATRLVELGALTGFPILADPLSGLRFGPHTAGRALICGAYENYLHHAPLAMQPQVILRFGAMPVSKRLGDFLARCDSAVQLHVRESGVWADEAHVVDQFLQVDAAAFCQELAASLKMNRDAAWLEQWRTWESKAQQIVAGFVRAQPFDGAYVAAILETLPPGARLLAGNSLPVRHVDQFGAVSGTPLPIVANRGASGIDGNISTGMGLAAASAQPVVILVGDITFYHDSNGLLAAKALGLNNVTIVLLNNNGGGIFQRLPISRFEPPFQELFQTPHNLDFSFFAQAYGFDYQLADGLDQFREALTRGIATPGPAIVEVQTDAKVDLALRRELEMQIEAALQEI